MKEKNLFIYSAGLMISFIAMNYVISQQNNHKKIKKQNEEVIAPHYEVHKFDLVDTLKGLSAQQIEQHQTLYAGYVKKRNEIAQKLLTVDRSDADNRSYSQYRALKLAETYAGNGDTLHRLYFENLGGDHHTIGKEMRTLIKKSFGSIKKFKQDLFDAANSSHGWVVTAYCLDDNLLHNYVLEAHNQTVPILVIPILVLDVYEHAYMIDFGIKRVPYLEVFWDNINWNVVEKRIDNYLHHALISE